MFPSRGEGSGRREVTAHTGESEEGRTEQGEGYCTHVSGGKEWPRAPALRGLISTKKGRAGKM